MGLTNPAFEPNEEQIRKHNSVLASDEYVVLVAAVERLLEYFGTNDCVGDKPCDRCRVTREAESVLAANKPWEWTGTRGPVE